MNAEHFFQRMAEYNNAIWPAQIISYVLAIIIIIHSIKQWKVSNEINTTILAILWMWNGAVTEILFFSKFQTQYYVWGILWILQGIFFLIIGLKHTFDYKIQKKLVFLHWYNIYILCPRCISSDRIFPGAWIP
jgi:heme exporter protein D